MIVLKLGGSLFDSAPDILRRVMSAGADVLIVPGGGLFADVVRDVYGLQNISQDAAHWMAILAMDQYAYYLADKSGMALTSRLVRKKGFRIALPYEILRRHDELQHSWDVTSDTIAAWMAYKTSSPFIKATDVDGIVLGGKLVESVKASDLMGRDTCVDRALPGFLIEHAMDAFVVNGLEPGRLEKALKRVPATGTKITGK